MPIFMSAFSYSELGVVGAALLVAASALKILEYFLRNKFGEKESNRYNVEIQLALASIKKIEDSMEGVKNKLLTKIDKIDDLEKIKNVVFPRLEKLYDMHCSPQAIGPDSIPRWYSNDKVLEEIKAARHDLEAIRNTAEDLKSVRHDFEIIRNITEEIKIIRQDHEDIRNYFRNLKGF